MIHRRRLYGSDRIRLTSEEVCWLENIIAKTTKEVGYIGSRREIDINGEIFTKVRTEVQYKRHGANLLKLFSGKMNFWKENLIPEQREMIKNMYYNTRDNNLIFNLDDVDELTQLRNLIREAKGCNRRAEAINNRSTTVGSKLTKLQRNLDGEDNE